jgi:hypothetical protein
MKAISVRQPWAWAIMHAGKDIENRDWPTKVRGRVAIHAAKGMTKDEYAEVEQFLWGMDVAVRIPEYTELTRGAVIGTVEIVDCISKSQSPWFFGKYGFVLRNPEPFAMPQQIKGALGFWEWAA